MAAPKSPAPIPPRNAMAAPKSPAPTPPVSPPPPSPSPSPSRPLVSLQQPSPNKPPSKPKKLLRRFGAVFRSFPIISPACNMPGSLLHRRSGQEGGMQGGGGSRVTGTIFGLRKSRVNLALQESPGHLPMLVLELGVVTGKLFQDVGSGMLRIVLECEKRAAEKTELLEEPIWSVFCNGRKTGYAVRRKPTDDDLNVMQLLHAVSAGAGVLPADEDGVVGDSYSPDGELAYIRAQFERVVGSKDSETFYMINPDAKTGPELSIFFVRTT